MGKRYIDAGQIRYVWMIDTDGTEHDGITLQSVIDKVPTADVVEVKRGNWKINEMCVYSGVVEDWRCSNCDNISVTPSRFCPFCGTYMRGEKKNDL